MELIAQARKEDVVAKVYVDNGLIIVRRSSDDKEIIFKYWEDVLKLFKDNGYELFHLMFE